MELERAMKLQPEYTVTMFRMISFAQGLAQIQRRIGEGLLVEGWGVVGGLVLRNVGVGILAGVQINYLIGQISEIFFLKSIIVCCLSFHIQ